MTDYLFMNPNLTYIRSFQWPHTDPMRNVSMKPPRKEINYTGMNVSSQYLILADSNLMTINPNILSLES